MKTTWYCLSFFFALLVASCASEGPKNENVVEPVLAETPFINPAFKGVAIPFEEHSFRAEKGATITSKSGSTIVFPPNSLVDKDGKLIVGKVDMTYREFSDPVDFFVAGIPMTYQSGETTYTFESSGMCEVYAFKDGEPVFVNQKNKPVVNLVSQSRDAGHNIYYLDTLKKSWIEKGKSAFKEVKKQIEKGVALVVAQLPKKEYNLPPAPVKPKEASGDIPLFDVNIPYADYVPELKLFKNTKFEVDESEKNFKAKDARVEWDAVHLKKSETEGIYIITFKSANRSVSYRVRPVFEGKDYAEALKVFNEKQKQYEAENKDLIQKRKLEEAAELKRWDEEKKRYAEELKRKEEEQKRREAESYKAGGTAMAMEITRTFSLDDFGIWNCDKPILYKGIEILATFIDENGKELPLTNITVVYKGFNGLLNFPNNSIKTIPNSENMIWGIVDNKFVYLSYADFKKCNITPDTKKYTFTMKVHPDEITYSEDIKKIVGLDFRNRDN